MSEATAELASFFDAQELDPESFHGFANTVFASARTYERFGELLTDYGARVEAGQGDALKVGVGYVLLGRFRQASEWLEQAGKSQYRHYYAARAYEGLEQWQDALKQYQMAASAGWDSFDTDMRCVAVHLKAGNRRGAEELAKAHERTGTDRAEWYYVRGLLAEDDGDRDGALNMYDKALTLDAEHCSAMFRAAWLYDLRGDDEQAISLYEQLEQHPRAHVNALINLAVIHEDNGRFGDAIACLMRVLAAYPNHTRARLFLKDVESSESMLIDDVAEKCVETRNRLLETPISEFELSVRARNCLKKMNIQTLGDLLNLSESELLAYKNFGETSLEEINVLLRKRGLRLGLKPDEIDPSAFAAPAAEPAAAPVLGPPGSEALLTKPVSEMELSVRARRCLQRLNIERLGDLIQRSESELLATRNFGLTSLTEIKSRLKDYGLTLASKA